MKIVFPVYVVLAAMIAPAALAGTAAEPEITDDPGDASRAALDVTSAWFNSANPRWADRIDRQLEVNIKLSDLGALAPGADGVDTDTRYYYDVVINHGDTGMTYKATCYVHIAYAVVHNPIGAQNYGVSGGCVDVMDSTTASILNVRMTVDLLNDIIKVTISRPYYGGVPLSPGTSLTVGIETASGNVATTAGSAIGRDVRGATLDFAGPASFTL